MSSLGLFILLIFSVSTIFAQEIDSLDPSFSDYYKFDGPADFAAYKPLAKASDFLKVLENRKLVDIDTKARYVFLYTVGTHKGTTKLDGRILAAEGFKKNIMYGVDLNGYTCTYGICSKPDSVCGPEDKYYAYEGGIIVWANSCGNLNMYLSLSKDRKIVYPLNSEVNLLTPAEEPEKPVPAGESTENGRFD